MGPMKLLTAGATAIVASALVRAGGSRVHIGQQASLPVSIRIDASKSLGPVRPVWRFIGCDEPNYATMPEGGRLLGEIGKLGSGNAFFRTHNLLTTGDGKPALKWGSTNAYTEDARGNPVYDWTILDGIFDAYRIAGVRPYVEIGFMPEALSIHPQPYRHHWTPAAKYDEIFTGWAHPPKDYAKWAELVYQWTKHCVERHGRAEVERWWWEVWNEPNIGYWRGTPEEFLKLHDFAIDAVRRALPTARVGGPDTAGDGGRFMQMFLDHCASGINYATGERGTPLDFVSFHAKGAPTVVDGHVRMGIASQLRTIDVGFRAIAARPTLRSKPIVIGESDPDGCAACQGPQLGYRNGTMYSSYTAACIARELELADRHSVNFAGALTWAFEFEDTQPFAGFRVLSTNGIDLPILNLFRLLDRMRGERVAAESSGEMPLDTILLHGVREAPDVSAMASREGNRLFVLLWHYHDDDIPGPKAEVSLLLAGLPADIEGATVRTWRIDEDHANPVGMWQQMGSPASPTAHQLAKLRREGRLGRPEMSIAAVSRGETELRVTMKRQAVALVEVSW